MDTNYSAQNTSVIGDEVCWLDEQFVQEFPGGLDLDEDDYLDIGNHEDPRLAFAIEGREVSLLAETADVAHILEDERQLYFFLRDTKQTHTTRKPNQELRSSKRQLERVKGQSEGTMGK